MKKYIIALLLTAIICAPFSLSAQITIGSGEAPSGFSVLELISNNERGLRLPRMTTPQRIALEETPEFQAEIEGAAMGLMIFNTTEGCLEVWSGSCWISLCDDSCEGFDRLNATWCAVDEPTIADLTAKASAAGVRGNIVWYNAAIGGSRFTNPNTPLDNGSTYWANCADATDRLPVLVTLQSNCNPLPFGSGRIAAFVNVMYDFQSQTLEAFTTTGGEATSWRWQMSIRVGGTTGFWPNRVTNWSDWSDWSDIPDANSARFTIPAYFMYTHAGVPNVSGRIFAPDDPEIMLGNYRTNTVEIRFRCIIHSSSPVTPTPPDGLRTDELNILFIRTNTSGFGGSDDGRYLTIRRAAQGGANPTGNSIRIALLNVGASSDIVDGSGGLGEFIQWGRTRKDGHSRTVWRIPTSGANRVPTIGTPCDWGGTSEIAGRGDFDASRYDDDGQVRYTATQWYGRFITTTTSGIGMQDWGTATTGRNDLWGNDEFRATWNQHTRATVPTSLDGAFGWAEHARNNNPCQYLGAGWRVPSRFDWWDMFRGTGSNNPVLANFTIHDFNSVNNWFWRGSNTSPNSDVLGGAVIFNQHGEAVFLPAAGIRALNTGERVHSSSWEGFYWSSTFGDVDNAWRLDFSGSAVSAGAGTQASGFRANGFFVRCVQ